MSVNLEAELGDQDAQSRGVLDTGVEDIAVLNQYSRRHQPLFNYLDNMRIQRAAASLEQKLAESTRINPTLRHEYGVKFLGQKAQDGILCALSSQQARQRTTIREKDYTKLIATFYPCDAYNPELVRIEAERRIHQLEQDSRSTAGSKGLFTDLVRDLVMATEIRQKQTITAGAGLEVSKEKKGILPWR
jgi:hypothetical protein